MNQTARIISIYTADTSGFCSALYEYGGMTVIHDASGCNSTYTTHDEPRWYDMDSMMYISGLTESDAVMGNDEKFVSDLCLAAEELRPAFIAICASALPAMVGIDMEAIAYEVESRTGIPAFEVKTNAMQSYITGAANAFVKLAERFAGESSGEKLGIGKENTSVNAGQKNSDLKVNVLGLTPLDFPLHSTTDLIRKWLEEKDCRVNAFVGMDTDLDDIRRLSQADVSLVVSSIGRPLAEYLYNRYGIPYVIGTPYGKSFSDYLAEKLRISACERQSINAVHTCRSEEKDVKDKTRVTIVGESIMSTSLAAAIYMEKGISVRVIESVGEGDMSVLRTAKTSEDENVNEAGMMIGVSDYDISCTEEDMLEMEIAKADVIIADPLFKPISNGKRFISLPHRAFSGRTFDREERQLITDIDDLV